MESRLRPRLATAALAALLLTGCGAAEAPAPEAPTTSAPTASGDETTAPVPAATAADDAPDAGDLDPVPVQPETTSPDSPSEGTEASTAEDPGTSAEGPAFAPDASSSGDFGEGVSTPTEIRTGQGDGYERIVLELAGDGRPGWTVSWTDGAAQLGSGDPVGLDAPRQLDVVVHGTTWEDSPLDPQTTSTPGGLPVRYAGAFESDAQIVVGADEDLPYRVFTLDAPTRLVIDVATD